MRPVDLPHLVRRFFGSLRPRRPSPADQAWIATVLAGETASGFWRQPLADQAHAVRVARRAREIAGVRPELVRAALLHDIGKTGTLTGSVSRSVASLLALARLPCRGRVAAYLDHGGRGARLLAAWGEPALVVGFAAHHHRPEAPDGVDPEDWSVLRRADHE